MNWFVKKSCPLVNDKKSNVRCTSPDKRRGTPRRMTWPATAQRWDPLLGELARILGTSSSPASTRGLAYISSDVCCSSYILRAPTVLVVSTRKYFVISYFLLRQQKTTASFIYSPCRPSISDVVSHHGASTCFRFFYYTFDVTTLWQWVNRRES